ncbi:glycosyl transferase [Dulcicalothrix desertica PCC 7102]|uniref:Glycosyl transferase n=1 Tax=Dulcicalothrix desertica PCC 7102 TaxID=232991 RepID=A0A3S1CKN5_9CYAN|nr:glycosyltransferase family 4 protein [Dulcicalothrix desertica]RUT05569.1 glycosyl transferase [Dulcicalothrix desertica PCC 7102]TWH54665.1 glycosyltransferase involved in cell wall biosynthesis [Dulcicalothrix desertica PCC 7102]
MKVIQLSTSDILGGASRSAYRLHEGLQQIGIDSRMLVQSKSSDNRAVMAPSRNLEQSISKLRVGIDVLPLNIYQKYRQRKAPIFSLQWLPDKIPQKVANFQADIINLHWVSTAYIRAETLAKFKQPLVWTLHDMWAFTGGCHYSGECNNYTASCGSCPQLGSNTKWDLSHWVWQRKAKAWKNLNLTIATPSSWLAKCASASSLFQGLRIEQIPYGLNTKNYRPINKKLAREILCLPQNKQLVLFGSLNATSDKRKGFHLLQTTLQELSQAGWHNKLELVIFGATQPENPPNFGFRANYLGTLTDDLSLTLLYSAADVFVLPSLEDNLPNTVLEAIACGTPCVAFNIGGMPDMIEHYKNGYLAQPFKITDLASGVAWVLENEERYQKLQERARQKTEQEFSLELQAHRYSSLYNDVLSKSNCLKHK